MRKVMIATPAHDGSVTVQYADSLLRTVRECARHDIEIMPIYWPGEALVQIARNNLVKIAVEGGFDDVVFIDADQEWDPVNVVTLLRHRVDVVGAAVRKKTDDRELYNVKAASINIPVDIRTGLWLVDAIGTGFLRLSRKALLALCNGAEEYRDDFGNVHRMVFEVGVIDGRLVGEDVAMCLKLRALGCPIHLDPTFTVSHIGTKTYRGGNFVAWIDRLRAEAAQRQTAS